MDRRDDPGGRDPRRRREPADDQTFADVLNSFSLGKSRKRSERPKAEEPAPEPQVKGRHELESTRPAPRSELFPPTEHEQPPTGYEQRPTGYGQRPTGYGQRPGYEQRPTGYEQRPTGYEQRPPVTRAPEPDEDGASIVRAYAWTGGRTSANYDFEIETMVTTSDRGAGSAAAARPEFRAVANLCRQPTSVAEVAALLSIPLGVAKVLLGDMADHGLIVVHETSSSNGLEPDMNLMERVLSGLRRL